MGPKVRHRYIRCHTQPVNRFTRRRPPQSRCHRLRGSLARETPGHRPPPATRCQLAVSDVESPETAQITGWRSAFRTCAMGLETPHSRFGQPTRVRPRGSLLALGISWLAWLAHRQIRPDLPHQAQGEIPAMNPTSRSSRVRSTVSSPLPASRCHPSLRCPACISPEDATGGGSRRSPSPPETSTVDGVVGVWLENREGQPGATPRQSLGRRGAEVARCQRALWAARGVGAGGRRVDGRRAQVGSRASSRGKPLPSAAAPSLG
jgi:hypothetical protein